MRQKRSELIEMLEANDRILIEVTSVCSLILARSENQYPLSQLRDERNEVEKNELKMAKRGVRVQRVS